MSRKRMIGKYERGEALQIKYVTPLENFIPAGFAIGDPITFAPSYQQEGIAKVPAAEKLRIMKVTGVIDLVNNAHRYFRVKYTAGGYTGHECFKF